MPDATPSPEERARELLAAEYGQSGADLGLKAEMMLQGPGPAIRALTAALTPSQPDTSAGDGTTGLQEILTVLSAATVEDGCTVFDHSAEEIGELVMQNNAAVRAALSTPSAGEGLVLVPRAPTPEMIDAGDDCYGVARGTESWVIGGCKGAEVIWSAMIAAAPANPSLSGTGEVE